MIQNNNLLWSTDLLQQIPHKNFKLDTPNSNFDSINFKLNTIVDIMYQNFVIR